MAALKVYSDESGKGDPRTFVMAGFIGRAEQWSVFEEDWRIGLAIPPAIDHFHMRDAFAAGEFERIAFMASVLRKYKFPALAVTFHTPDFNAIIRGRISRRYDTPYFLSLALLNFLSLALLMELAVQWQVDHGLCEPMDFIFDEQLVESDHLQSVWEDTYTNMSPAVRERFGQRPIHMDDTKTIPLQAADMLAWALRRISDDSKPHLETESLLTALFAGISITQDIWTIEKMVSFMTYHKRQNSRLGRMTDHEFSRVKQNLDMFLDGFNRYSIKKAMAGETIPLAAIQAKGTGRFRLVDSCPSVGTPHLHRRSEDECLGAPQP